MLCDPCEGSVWVRGGPGHTVHGADLQDGSLRETMVDMVGDSDIRRSVGLIGAILAFEMLENDSRSCSLCSSSWQRSHRVSPSPEV